VAAETKFHPGQVWNQDDSEPASLLQDRTKPDEAKRIRQAELNMRDALHHLGKEAEQPGSGGRVARSLDTQPRRRFVHDGDIPVTVVRRGSAGEASTFASDGATKRLQSVETALAEETRRRVCLQQLLDEANAKIRDLQTRLGHMEVARDEVMTALEKERVRTASDRRHVSKRHKDAAAEIPEINVASLEDARRNAEPEPVKWWLIPKRKR
jgi:hypothetical protein